jgi:hypothetical protein
MKDISRSKKDHALPAHKQDYSSQPVLHKTNKMSKEKNKNGQRDSYSSLEFGASIIIAEEVKETKVKRGTLPAMKKPTSPMT